MSHDSPPSFDAIFHAQKSQTPRRSSSSSFTGSMTHATHDSPYSHQIGTSIHDEPGPLSHKDSNASLGNRSREEPAARLSDGMRGVSMSGQQGIAGPSRVDSLPFDPESAIMIATAPRGGKGSRRNIGEIMYSPTPQYPAFAQQQQHQQQPESREWSNPEDQYAQYVSVPSPNPFPIMTSPFPQSFIPTANDSGVQSTFQDQYPGYMNGQSGLQSGSWGADYYNQEMAPGIASQSTWSSIGGDQSLDMGMTQDSDTQHQLQDELERIISNSAMGSRSSSPFPSFTPVQQSPYSDHNLSPYQSQQFQRPTSPYDSHNITFQRPSPPTSASFRKTPSPHPASPFTKPQSPPALIIPNHSPSPKLPPIVTTAPTNGNGGMPPPRQGATKGMGGGSGGLLPPVNPALEHLTGMAGISPVGPSADGPQIYIQPSTPISGMKDGRGIWEAALRNAGNQPRQRPSKGYNVPPPASHPLSRPSSVEHLRQTSDQSTASDEQLIDYQQLFSQWNQQQNHFPGPSPNASNTVRQRSKSESFMATSPTEILNRDALIQAMAQSAQQQRLQADMGQNQQRGYVDNWKTALIGDNQQDGQPTLDPRNLPGQDITNNQHLQQAQNHLDFSAQLAQLQAQRDRIPNGIVKIEPGEMSPTSMAFYQSLGMNPTTASQIPGTSSAPYYQSTFNISQAPPQPDWANFNPHIWPQMAGPAMQSFLSPNLGGAGPRRKSYTEGSSVHPAMGAGTPGYGIEFSGVGAGMMGKVRGVSAGLGNGHRRGVKSEDFGRGGTGWGVGTGGSTADFLDSITANDGSLLPPTRGRSSSHSRHSSASSIRSVSPSLSISSQGSSYGDYSPRADMPEGSEPALLPRRGTGRGRGRGSITKMRVTSAATEVASSNRRTNDGVFKCPVPGCGSTFTRHFNLKGHLRSHNDERPYKCLYEGCPKAEVGFARQHDCKRHMLLHEGLRPFECEGCGKNFARLDALTRHLKSEQGQECAQTNPLPLNMDGTALSESQFKTYLMQKRSGGLLVPAMLERLPGSDWGSGEDDDLGTGSGMDDYDRF